jgi:hypothetical protein
MEPRTASEAQLWRRCSLAAIAVLVLSIAGEQVLTMMEPDAQPAPKPCTYRFPYAPQARSFRALEQFVTAPAR